jgi:tRNA threonylcarbamoyladenosine biosynthesis protein TsaB
MNILALDTSTEHGSVALSSKQGIDERVLLQPRMHAKTLLPMIESLLNANQLGFQDLDAIAYGVGPGSFTGLRIAASVAQGLAFANNLPVIGVSSLLAMAYTGFATHHYPHIAVALDARMQEIYWARFALDEQKTLHLMDAECVITPEATAKITDKGWLGVGNGFAVYPALAARQCQLDKIDSTIMPKAKSIAKLAPFMPKQQDGLALPVYIRNNVAHQKR